MAHGFSSFVIVFWLIDAEEGIFRADFRKLEVTVTFQTSRLISITK